VPEGDTVYRAARELRAALEGQVLTRCDIRVPRFATVDLSGRTVDSVVSRGKHLLIRAGDASIHSHLKMEGQWQVYALGQKWRRPAHTARIVLETAQRQAVGFELGVLEVLPLASEAAELDYLGPDLLGPDWDADVALANLLAAPQRPVGVALLDQRNLAGLGNVYKSELCFLRGVLPQTPMGDVPLPEKVVDLAYRLIQANKDRPSRITTGNTRAGQNLWVYNRAGKPCRRCGTRIEEGELGADELQLRTTFWCPNCQR
jgi:endonuclease-8